MGGTDSFTIVCIARRLTVMHDLILWGLVYSARWRGALARWRVGALARWRVGALARWRQRANAPARVGALAFHHQPIKNMGYKLSQHH